MKLIQCDICEVQVPESQNTSTSQERMKSVLKLIDYEEFDNKDFDICCDCSYGLENQFDKVVSEWKESKGAG